MSASMRPEQKLLEVLRILAEPRELPAPPSGTSAGWDSPGTAAAPSPVSGPASPGQLAFQSTFNPPPSCRTTASWYCVCKAPRAQMATTIGLMEACGISSGTFNPALLKRYGYGERR